MLQTIEEHPRVLVHVVMVNHGIFQLYVNVICFSDDMGKHVYCIRHYIVCKSLLLKLYSRDCNNKSIDKYKCNTNDNRWQVPVTANYL